MGHHQQCSRVAADLRVRCVVSHNTPVQGIPPLVHSTIAAAQSPATALQGSIGIILLHHRGAWMHAWPIFNLEIVSLSAERGNDVGNNATSVELGESSKAVRIVRCSCVPDTELVMLRSVARGQGIMISWGAGDKDGVGLSGGLPMDQGEHVSQGQGKCPKHLANSDRNGTVALCGGAH